MKEKKLSNGATATILRYNLRKARLFTTFCTNCAEIIDSNLCDTAGLEYLHGQDPPIIHNDIKEKNVLVFKAGAKKVVKFTDFGSALLSIAITLNTA